MPCMNSPAQNVTTSGHSKARKAAVLTVDTSTRLSVSKLAQLILRYLWKTWRPGQATEQHGIETPCKHMPDTRMARLGQADGPVSCHRKGYGGTKGVF